MSLRALVALGSNLGDRQAHLESGLAALQELGRVTPSPLVMETKDITGTGPDYLNTVALLDSDLDDPCLLLERLLRIELRLGRDRLGPRYAARTLDLDLIEIQGLSGHWGWPAPADLQGLGTELTLDLPHPRAAEREFVQKPWAHLKAIT